jgi:hypothetical protein
MIRKETIKESRERMFKRVHLIVMDSVGIGEAPDAEKFGDVGSDTLGHIAKEAGLDDSSFGTIRLRYHPTIGRCQRC